ncbi:MAG: glycosyltransferase [Mucilaginibacter polytrichastri]|nr:glycosyltransferase [Mucilaginibacter polytrichastri]
MTEGTQTDNVSVSVITVYYNRQDDVDDSIRSILNQSHPDFEFIIIDDCSKDDTFQKLSSFASDPRVRLIRNETNQGFVRNVKMGVELARGKYIAIHGSGDISLPERLSRQAAVLDSEKDIVLVGCFLAHIDKAGTVLNTQAYNEYIDRNDLLEFNKLSHGEVMYRKSDYLQAGGYREAFRFAQDYDLWLRLTRFGKAKIIQETLYMRTALEEGASFSPAKIIKQCMFAKLAKDIATSDEGQQKKVLEVVQQKGVDAVISIADPYVQRNIFSRFNYLISKSQVVDASFFVDNARGFYRPYYSLVFWLSRTAVFSRPLLALYRLKYK